MHEMNENIITYCIIIFIPTRWWPVHREEDPGQRRTRHEKGENKEHEGMREFTASNIACSLFQHGYFVFHFILILIAHKSID